MAWHGMENDNDDNIVLGCWLAGGMGIFQNISSNFFRMIV
jgi:hypothetical protein